jgi:hypothetical protein
MPAVGQAAHDMVDGVDERFAIPGALVVAGLGHRHRPVDEAERARRRGERDPFHAEPPVAARAPSAQAAPNSPRWRGSQWAIAIRTCSGFALVAAP